MSLPVYIYSYCDYIQICGRSKSPQGHARTGSQQRNSLSPNDKTVLKDTFANAKLPAEIEVYAGAAHGWCPPDSGVYNEPQAEKAWSRLLVLYGKALA